MIHKPIAAPASPFVLSRVLEAPALYNQRRASPYITRLLMRKTNCTPARADFTLHGRTAIDIKREVNAVLAQELASGTHGAAFADACVVHDRPRADDIEAMIAAFPALERINWDAPPVKSGLDPALWLTWHARHCQKCTPLTVHDDCYFKVVHHFINTGFEPPVAPGVDLRSATPSCRAYVDKWKAEEEACQKAFAKWVNDSEKFMSEPSSLNPAVCFPLLPVVRVKDRWRFEHGGDLYKVRLCLDLKNGGLNDMLDEWKFRYLMLEDIPKIVKQGDWLATIDISRFYLRLPAGQTLSKVQCFQDPSSYASSKHNNERMHQAKMKYRYLRSVAFGLKSAPAYASVVSAELARILRSFGVKVAGVYVDDLLIAASTREKCLQALKIAQEVCASLGLHINEKTQGPSQRVKYLGIIIRTDVCSFSVCPEQREYAIDRITELLRVGVAAKRELESIGGVLTWISFAMISGKPRRNLIYRAVTKAGKSSAPITIDAQLRRQLHWWKAKLSAKGELSCFFWDRQPDTPVVCSDASGDDGWGACTMGYHLVGPWPEDWKQSSSRHAPHMLFKEIAAPIITTMVFGHCLSGKVLCSAMDNSGAAFVVNKLSCSCPRTLAMLRAFADVQAANRFSVLAGHAHRHHNCHADHLSHSLNDRLWSQVAASAPVKRSNRMELHFAILDIRRTEAFLATISFPRPFLPAAPDAIS